MVVARGVASCCAVAIDMTDCSLPAYSQILSVSAAGRHQAPQRNPARRAKVRDTTIDKGFATLNELSTIYSTQLVGPSALQPCFSLAACIHTLSAF